MILKTVLLFLVFIGVVGMFGKLRWLDPRLKAGKAPARRCPRCKQPLVGRDCLCEVRR